MVIAETPRYHRYTAIRGRDCGLDDLGSLARLQVGEFTDAAHRGDAVHSATHDEVDQIPVGRQVERAPACGHRSYRVGEDALPLAHCSPPR